MFESKDRKRLSDVVAGRIRDFVLTNRLQPGDRLPTELELAKQFGVSRVSIREATKALCFLGFLDATPRRGTILGQVDFRRVSRFLELHSSLRDATPTQLIETLKIVELGSLPHLCERLSQDGAARGPLDQILTDGRDADSLADWLDLQCQFHCQLVEACGLPPLFLFRELCTYCFGRLQSLLPQPAVQARLETDRLEKSANDHRLVDLLQQRQLEPARLVLEARLHDYEAVLLLHPSADHAHRTDPATDPLPRDD